MIQDQLFQSKAFSSRQGSLGEQFALAFELRRLPKFLHGKIVHFETHQIALGYDILSFETPTSILPGYQLKEYHRRTIPDKAAVIDSLRTYPNLKTK